MDEVSKVVKVGRKQSLSDKEIYQPRDKDG